MLYRKLGNTGLKVSLLSYGSWITFGQMTTAQVNEIIKCGFDHGINLFDSAEVYGEGIAESKLGDSLQQLAIPREKYILSTKVFWGGNSPTECGLTRKHIIEGCHRSLMRLKADYLDIYLCHRPDNNVPIIETVYAMNILIQQGKILYWGTSEWPNDLLIEAYHVAKQHHLIPPSLEQVEYSLLCRERLERELPVVQDKTQLGICVTMPLACGMLAGRYNHGIPADSRANLSSHTCFKEMVTSEAGINKIKLVKKLEHYANQIDMTVAELALYWCMSNSRVTSVIIGTTKLDQLKNNLNTLRFIDDKKVPATFFNDIDEIMQNKTMPVHEPSYAEVIAES